MEKDEEGKVETKEEYKTKITITKEAERLFSEIVDKVNNGFEAGHVERSQAASWLITRFFNKHSDADIKDMRSDHLKDGTLLDSFYRKMKDVDNLPPEVKKLLLSALNFEDGKKVSGSTMKRGKNTSGEASDEAAD